jgi:hypothetical protein
MGFWEICALTWEPFSNSFLDRSFTFAPSFLPNRKVLLWEGTEAVRRSVNGSERLHMGWCDTGNNSCMGVN